MRSPIALAFQHNAESSMASIGQLMTNRRVSSGLTRRACLTAAATLPLSAGMAAQARAGTQAAAPDNAGPAAAALSAREEFGDIAGTYALQK